MTTEQQIWYGDHLGLRFVVKCTKKEYMRDLSGSPDAWTFYVHFPVDRIPAEHRASFVIRPTRSKYSSRARYRYENSPVYNLAWHGGCTYYARNYTNEGKLYSAEFGCDYQHIWDDGKFYDSDWVIADAKALIEEAVAKFPFLEKKVEVLA